MTIRSFALAGFTSCLIDFPPFEQECDFINELTGQRWSGRIWSFLPADTAYWWFRPITEGAHG